eukprot:644940-Pleurochrysis_carterae.AAC.1
MMVTTTLAVHNVPEGFAVRRATSSRARTRTHARADARARTHAGNGGSAPLSVTWCYHHHHHLIMTFSVLFEQTPSLADNLPLFLFEFRFSWATPDFLIGLPPFFLISVVLVSRGMSVLGAALWSICTRRDARNHACEMRVVVHGRCTQSCSRDSLDRAWKIRVILYARFAHTRAWEICAVMRARKRSCVVFT